MFRATNLFAGALAALLAGGAVAWDGTVEFPAADDALALDAPMVASLTSCHEYAKASGMLRSEVDMAQARHFVVEAHIVVPAKVEGFFTFDDAMAADVRVRLWRASEGDFAECLLAVQPLLRFEPVTYRVELVQSGDFVKPINGVCDVDLYQPGIQVGIPELAAKDKVVVSNVIGQQLFDEHIAFVEGYCE